jgi:hypothetical protein
MINNAIAFALFCSVAFINPTPTRTHRPQEARPAVGVSESLDGLKASQNSSWQSLRTKDERPLWEWLRQSIEVYQREKTILELSDRCR